MKKLAISAAALAALTSFSYAGIDFDRAGKTSLKDEINQFEASLPVSPLAGKAPAAEWTVMVYINAKNNLEEFGLQDLNEMEIAGSSDKVNVVVELGRMAGYDDTDGDWKGSRRYLVRKDSDFSSVTSSVVADLGKVDMGDYRHLSEFGNWAKAAYPAKKYMLIVWNHGSGWDKNAGRAARGISYDDETGNYINTPQLGLALKEMGGVNVYGSDACLMQMAEVAYELKDLAGYIVGSEETEPGDGYTYNTMLTPLLAKPAMAPAELSKLTVNAYSDYYAKKGQASTQSDLKASALPRFLGLVNDWVSAVTLAGDKKLVRWAGSKAESYSTYDNKDLYHFVQLVGEGTKDKGVAEKGRFLMDFITKELVMTNRVNESANGGGGENSDWNDKKVSANSHGIAVCLPDDAPADGYRDLAWAKASGWDEFLKWYRMP